MSFSDEEIIAFLLGEADDLLVGQIQGQLKQDSELVARVSHFRSLLNHMVGSGECYEPPGGLVEATLARVSAMDSPSGDPLSPDNPNADAGREECDATKGDLVKCGAVGNIPSRTSIRGFLTLANRWDWSAAQHGWMDSAVVSISLVCLSCLLLPAILRVRFESRRIQCADNLRLNGQALISFAIGNVDQRLPALTRSGPEAIAGVYAVRLYNAGLLHSTGQLHCVSLVGIDRPAIKSLAELPTLSQLPQHSREQLVIWHRIVGGDYAYNLGVMERQNVPAHMCVGRSYFAILADAPLIDGDTASLVAHDGYGINVLYDDGHVEFVSRSREEDGSLMGGHPLDTPARLRMGVVEETDMTFPPTPIPTYQR